MAGRHRNTGFFGNLFGGYHGSHRASGTAAQASGTANVGRGRTAMKYGGSGRPSRTRDRFSFGWPVAQSPRQHERRRGGWW